MNVFGSLRRWCFIFWMVIPAGLAGAFFTAYASEMNTDPLPPSNNEVVGIVLSDAMGNLGIPEGKGVDVFFCIEGESEKKDIIRVIAEKFLLEHGYRVHETGKFPEFRFGLDSLYIKLDLKKEGKKNIVERFAEAKIVAIFQETEISRKVYNGSGVFKDEFPAKMMGHVGEKDPVIVNHRTFYGVIKPVFFGLIMTGLVWLLYSYRG
jgi:hypothetical protein